MSYLADNWYWMVAAAGSGGALFWLNLKQGGGGTGISPQEAVMLMNREKAHIIDVGASDTFKAGHIRGARHIPLEQLAENAKGLPNSKQAALVVVCATGAQAGKAVKQLQQLGYERAQALKGGMRAWREAQLPTESAAA